MAHRTRGPMKLIDELEHCYTARSAPRKWYKIIDRITPELRHKPKLLIPDIKANGDAITYDAGNFYPHHNLYYITSQQWNLRAPGTTPQRYRTPVRCCIFGKIGGGYLRFQAQNLKRIRIPYWHDISPDDQQHMIHLGEAGENYRYRCWRGFMGWGRKFFLWINRDDFNNH